MTYLGNAPYCYASTLAMTLGSPVAPATVEALTGSAFGFQRIGDLPLFDPPGWDPDQGIDQALAVMGVRHERMTFPDEAAALATLRRLVAAGPVFVGPLEMGLLRHQGGSDRPMGADHFVAVVALDDRRVVMHDPQGHPYAQLPLADFLAAWGSGTIAYAEGRFPLRTGFSAPVGTVADWARAVLPHALAWAEGRHAVGDAPGDSVAALQALRDETRAGRLSPVAASVLREFAVRAGARRRADTADLLHRFEAPAALLTAQAETLGGAQLDVIDADWAALAARLDRLAALQRELTEALRALAG